MSGRHGAIASLSRAPPALRGVAGLRGGHGIPEDRGMTDRSGHYGEELQDLLDGRLAEPRRAEIAAHVADCEQCQRELDALRWIKTEVPRELGEADFASPELIARLRASLDAADVAD